MKRTLLGLGVLALVVVLFAVVPAGLSPVGVATGQDTGPLVTEKGSIQINDTRSNRTQIVLDTVTLPRNGFIVAQIQNEASSSNKSIAKTKIVGHTEYVRGGTFHDVILTLDKPIDDSTVISVALYNDTNGNETLETGSKADVPYQTNDGTPIHDTVTIGQTQTGNQTTKVTEASVVFKNQTINGTNVTISSVTLPEGGYVALHDSSYLEEMAPKNISVIAVSRYLSPGHYENLTIPIRHSPPAGMLNKTHLNRTQRLVAVPYHETTGNHRYEFVLSFGENDTPYLSQSTPVVDTARVAVRGTRGAPGYEPPTAAVTVSNQKVAGSLLVSRARLPDGGFLVVRTASPENGSLESVIGHSQYLAPGTNHNVSITLNASITQRQTLFVVPALDTNENRRYDFVQTNGFQDAAYRNSDSTRAVATQVVVHSTAGPTTGTATETPITTATTTPINTSTPFVVTNLSVSNRTAYVDHQVIVTAWIENPTQHRLTDDLAVATAGEIIETKPAALFPQERRAVKFVYTYGSPGSFVIKVGNQTEQIRIVPEGTPLTTMAVNGSEADGGQSQSNTQSQSGGWGSLLWIAGGALVLGLIGVVAIVILNRT